MNILKAVDDFHESELVRLCREGSGLLFRRPSVLSPSPRASACSFFFVPLMQLCETSPRRCRALSAAVFVSRCCVSGYTRRGRRLGGDACRPPASFNLCSAVTVQHAFLCISLVLIQFFHNVGCLFDSQEISHINKKEAVRDSGVTYRVYSTAAGTSQPSRRRS